MSQARAHVYGEWVRAVLTDGAHTDTGVMTGTVVRPTEAETLAPVATTGRREAAL